MARKRKIKPSGIVTVLVMVLGAALLIVVGNWMRGSQPRRVPMGVSPPPGIEDGSGHREIEPEERDQLESILEKKAKP